MFASEHTVPPWLHRIVDHATHRTCRLPRAGAAGLLLLTKERADACFCSAIVDAILTGWRGS
jgi:hypothetical protein